MGRDTSDVTVICSSCGARYIAQIDWVDSAVEFTCSCGARLKPNTPEYFEVRHKMTDRREITLRPFSKA
jgi:hypothetical protein